MRTDDEIAARIAARKTSDWLGFESSDLLPYLSFARAKELGMLVNTATEADWVDAKGQRSQEPEDIKKVIFEYMPFAWEKANDCRGISASRSIHHMAAWLWLLENPLSAKVDTMDYQYYGKEFLSEICDYFEWDWSIWDDGDWRMSESGPKLTAAQGRAKAGLHPEPLYPAVKEAASNATS